MKARFQASRRRSRSNTVMPWRAWSSACWSRSRLYWIAAEASSRSCSAASRRDVAPAQQERQRQPRRGGADGRGEEVLGIAQQVDVGLRRRLERAAAAVGEALEGAVGALLAEIARDGRAQFVDGDARRGRAGSSAPSTASSVADEGVGLQPLEGVRRPQQREADIGEEVEREAPEHAMRELRQRRAARARSA